MGLQYVAKTMSMAGFKSARTFAMRDDIAVERWMWKGKSVGNASIGVRSAWYMPRRSDS